jgi:hypothetical protein
VISDWSNGMKQRESQAGFALAAVVFVLVIMGLLATGGFYVARQETRIGMASERANTAFYLAERGVNEVMAKWDGARFAAMDDWTTVTVSDTTTDGVWSVDVTRMAEKLYFLLASGGNDLGDELLGDANRFVGVVARQYSIDIDPPAAFTARDKVRFVGKATVRGADNHPAGWNTACAGKGLTDKPGMLTDNIANVDYNPKNFDVTGTPPILEDSALIEETFKIFADLTWDELTSMATHTLSPRNFNTIGPTLVNGGCERSNLENWGDPEDQAGPCANYFPLIHLKGPGISRINGGGVGQGIILVDGDFWAGGSFEFYGLIIVKGSFETGGSGNRVYGSVMAENADLEEQDLTGGSMVQYSSCALNRAINENPDLNWVRPVERRGWVDLSSVYGG